MVDGCAVEAGESTSIGSVNSHEGNYKKVSYSLTFKKYQIYLWSFVVSLAIPQALFKYIQLPPVDRPGQSIGTSVRHFTSALAGDPDPYPQVFQVQNAIPGSVVVRDICFQLELPFLAILFPSMENIFCSVFGGGFI